MSGLPSHAGSWASFARNVIAHAVCREDPLRAAAPPAEPRAYGGVFVTLKKLDRLRGCMGTLDPSMALVEAVREAAVRAALYDPRFPPVVAPELPDLRVAVSILSELRLLRELHELQLGRHGILVRQAERRGLFLPQVASEHGLDRETFLLRCCAEKAGLPPDAWRDPATEVFLFTTEVFEEPP